MTRAEFDEVVSLMLMKSVETPGIDGIASEVWKHSLTARDALFKFLQEVWKKEDVSVKLTVCVRDDLQKQGLKERHDKVSDDRTIKPCLQDL